MKRKSSKAKLNKSSLIIATMSPKFYEKKIYVNYSSESLLTKEFFGSIKAQCSAKISQHARVFDKVNKFRTTLNPTFKSKATRCFGYQIASTFCTKANTEFKFLNDISCATVKFLIAFVQHLVCYTGKCAFKCTILLSLDAHILK